MNIQSIIIIALVGIAFVGVCVYIIKKRKRLFRCSSCDGDCSKCLKSKG